MFNPKYIGQFDGLDIYYDVAENKVALQCSFGRGYSADIDTVYLDSSVMLSLMIAYVSGMPLPTVAPYEVKLSNNLYIIRRGNVPSYRTLRIMTPVGGYWLKELTAQELITYLRKENVP